MAPQARGCCPGCGKDSAIRKDGQVDGRHRCAGRGSNDYSYSYASQPSYSYGYVSQPSYTPSYSSSSSSYESPSYGYRASASSSTSSSSGSAPLPPSTAASPSSITVTPSSSVAKPAPPPATTTTTATTAATTKPQNNDAKEFAPQTIVMCLHSDEALCGEMGTIVSSVNNEEFNVDMGKNNGGIRRLARADIMPLARWPQEWQNNRNLANKAYHQGDFASAQLHYAKLAEAMMQHALTEKSLKLANALRLRSNKTAKLALECKAKVGGKQGEVTPPPPPAPAPENKASLKKEGDDDENAKLRAALSSVIVVERPEVKWTDVAGLETAKETLKEAVIMPQKFPQLFTGERRPWAGILLYGPPGTGKSHLAKAVATESESTFFSVSSSDLVSKWQGESERLVRQLFEMAREASPAIIFIDEVDSLCGSRSDGDQDSVRRIKTEFLVQMDGVKKSGTASRVLVLGATNTPWTLDPAMRRRFEKRIYIPLPDQAARSAIFKSAVGATPHALPAKEFDRFANLTEGYSGADISVLVRSALMEPLKLAQRAQFFRIDANDGKYTPLGEDLPCPKCPPSAEAKTRGGIKCTQCGAVRIGLFEIESSKLKVPDVSNADFEKALKQSKASVSAKELKRFTKWTTEFGIEG